jgi:hypothetical protein
MGIQWLWLCAVAPTTSAPVAGSNQRKGSSKECHLFAHHLPGAEVSDLHCAPSESPSSGASASHHVIILGTCLSRSPGHGWHCAGASSGVHQGNHPRIRAAPWPVIHEGIRRSEDHQRCDAVESWIETTLRPCDGCRALWTVCWHRSDCAPPRTSFALACCPG